MSQQSSHVIAVGEATIELTRSGEGGFAMGCGGDSFNTAIYLARAGIDVSYATALGSDDPYSNSILALATAEGVKTDVVLRVPGRLPGIALVETDAAGKRRSFQWRENSPARDLFELPDWSRIAASLTAAQLIYFSGITLSLYSNAGLGRFLASIELARQHGAKVAFDGNFRPHGWRGDLVRARAVFIETLKRVDMALPAFDDEAVLWGDASPEATIERLQAFGIPEIAVKNGPHSALVATGGKQELVPVPEVVEPVDITAAGDSFNAGYLAARLKGDNPIAAATAAHRLAGEKIRHRGALMPRNAAAMH
jgi:2-dehydro-3-deoxygluconokinase